MGTILVIEDEPHIRFLLKNILDTTEHRVSEAEDGGEALNLIQARFEPFSLIILDLRLPKMDGFEFLHRLRQQYGASIPVLVLTVHPNLFAKAIEQGADACLTKPFRRKQLIATVDRLTAPSVP